MRRQCVKLKLQYQVVIQDNILISNQYSIGMHLCYLEIGYISVLWPVTILSTLDFWFMVGLVLVWSLVVFFVSSLVWQTFLRGCYIGFFVWSGLVFLVSMVASSLWYFSGLSGLVNLLGGWALPYPQAILATLV